ncbi:MAG TPA: hypothetical protein H9778_07895 [Candidatus Parabacteroides intestinavium]|nr:hypothetical protein [Candidatus Parabacteroides intestinavium]
MNYKKKKYEDKAVEAQIASFTGNGGITEYQVFLQVTDPMLPFEQQLQHIQQAYVSVVKEELADDAVAVFRRYFLSDAANQADLVMAWECENAFCALSVVQQAPLNGTKIAIWTWFQTGVSVETEKNGMLKATHNGYTQYWTGGAFNRASNSEYQTRLLLNDYVMQLTEEGCKLATDCIRTWFFVQNVDVNYAGVVKARKEVFITQDLTEKTHYIASTGIGGRNADPAVLVTMDTYAVKGLKPEQIQFLYAPTHLNPTYEYGVTFERGTAVHYADRTQVFISGTASIDNKGNILYPGDICQQAARMLRNISALLTEAGATTEDIQQAIVYLRDTADYQVVEHFLAENYPGLPHIIVHAPVCRPGWLIEMECMAVVPSENTAFGVF